MVTKTPTKTGNAKKASKLSANGAKHVAKKKAAVPANGIRVRMYRIGFGDFFLLTVPTDSGPQHILIDCGVFKGDLKTIKACVQNLATETDRKLALVIATHYHADHISGFASNFDEFAKFEVGAVWLPNRLDPKRKQAMKFKAQITSVARQLQLRLGARQDDAGIQALNKVQDALGVGEGSNEKALRLLTEGFKNKPPVFYYEAGNEPDLPESIKGAITAELLGPAPLSTVSEFLTPENKAQQYLSAVAEEGLPPSDVLNPFEKKWPAVAADYPQKAFQGYRTREQIEKGETAKPAELEKVLQAVQPDVLLAIAETIDGTLNNQSLVVLFTCQGKKLLFVGDAQWGNWSYWLYGKKTTGKTVPGITDKARDILGSIDFYKVGHHGSTNANPIPAVAAINVDCVSMCSTESGDPDRKRPHGDIKNESEVPRIKLLEEMQKRTNNRLVRSDWIEVPNFDASPEARAQLAKLPPNFSTGDLYIDYVFP
jgi:beta-lactamase superfamily II metal-dependent hydrolase